jgi:hypothetical protein
MRCIQSRYRKEPAVNKSLLLLSFWAVSAAPAVADDLKYGACSFDGGSGAVKPQCAHQSIENRTIEIAKLPQHQNVYMLKIDADQAKRFEIEDRTGLINRGSPVPFLVDSETLGIAYRDLLNFYKIPSVFALKEGDKLPISYHDRLSHFFVVDPAGEGLARNSSAEFAGNFGVDPKGVYFKTGRARWVYINPKIDSGWVDAEYLKTALLTAAADRFDLTEASYCRRRHGKRKKKQQKCLEKADAKYKAAVAAIKEGKPQTYVGPGLADTSLGQFYTSPAEGARYGLVVAIDTTERTNDSVLSLLLMITNPGGGKTAPLKLGADNPYLTR